MNYTIQAYKGNLKNFTIDYGYGITPYGAVLLGVAKNKICYLAFIKNDTKEAFTHFKKVWLRAKMTQDDKKIQTWLDKIFNDPDAAFTLCVRGTAFQRSVWNALLEIPFGRVCSYQDIAERVHKPKAVRAAANAIGANAIAYLIPCHRVIAKSGAVSGYRWGVEKKKMLLAFEAKEK